MMSLFRAIVVLFVLGFGAASFLFGMQVKAKYWEQERYLWESRRENRRLRVSMEETGDRNACLERAVASLTRELEGRERRIADLESRLRNAELDLAIAGIDRDDLIRDNARLAERARRLEGSVEALAAQIYRAQLESEARDWLANLKEAGRLVASAIPAPAWRPRAEPASAAPVDVAPDPAPLAALDSKTLVRWNRTLQRVVESLRGMSRELQPWVRCVAVALRETANLRCSFPMAFPF
jgi:hypothetical protein